MTCVCVTIPVQEIHVHCCADVAVYRKIRCVLASVSVQLANTLSNDRVLRSVVQLCRNVVQLSRNFSEGQRETLLSIRWAGSPLYTFDEMASGFLQSVPGKFVLRRKPALAGF